LRYEELLSGVYMYCIYQIIISMNTSHHLTIWSSTLPRDFAEFNGKEQEKKISVIDLELAR
jgi:hypothetical protein